RLQVEVAGELAAAQIENYSISAEISEGVRKRISLGFTGIVRNIVSYRNDACVRDGKHFGAITPIVVDIRSIPVDQITVFVRPVEIDCEALGNKHAPFKLKYACGVMVVTSRPVQHNPGLTSDRRAQTENVLADRGPRIPNGGVLRIACNAETDAVV